MADTDRLSRRAFLSEAAWRAMQAGAGLSLLSQAGCGSGPSETARTPLASGNAAGAASSDGIFADLKRRLSGPVLMPGDAGYDAISRPNNLRYASVLPAAIARCTSARDVASAILWARHNGMTLAPRCGGHNFAGYSTTTGLLLDVSLMNSVQFDASSGIITIGAGVINHALYAALAEVDAAITHGRCATVGASGFILGGGIGFNMRAHGVAVDHLIGTTIVLADGSVLALDETHDSDLFWACRGAAGRNFGVHTSFRLRTFAAPSITVFSIDWDSNQPAALAALVQALDGAPDTLGSRVGIEPVTPAQHAAGRDFALNLLGQIAGTPQELAAILQPVFQVAPPSSQTVEQMPYWKGQAFLEESGLPDRYQERSRFFAALSTDVLDAVVAQARTFPGGTEGPEITFFQTGGQMNAVAPDATAFVHRDSRWLMAMSVSWGADTSSTVVDQNLAWLATAYETLIAFTRGGAFQNFPDPSLVDFAEAYYGSNLSRLQRIKAAVDPTRFFEFPQAIPPP